MKNGFSVGLRRLLHKSAIFLHRWSVTRRSHRLLHPHWAQPLGSNGLRETFGTTAFSINSADEVSKLPSIQQTWKWNMVPWKSVFLYEQAIFHFHDCFREGKAYRYRASPAIAGVSRVPRAVWRRS